MANYLQIALEYHTAGLDVISYTKRPPGQSPYPSWEKWETERQSEADVRRLFSRDCDGIALICKDGIEGVDIDVKHDPEKKIAELWFGNVKLYASGEEALKMCVIQKTRNAGWHIIYRTNTHEGNQKLARLSGKKEAVIETRGGSKGLLHIYPMPGYEIKRGDFKNIQLISDKARECFMRCAKELDERQEADEVPKELPKHKAQNTKPVFESGSLTPGDDFNAQHDVLDIAEKYGWQVVSRHGNTHLTKPGSKSGECHASIVVTKNGERRFFPFTTATAYNPEKCYSPFGMYAVEEHGGDMSAAAKELYRQGFGARVQKEIVNGAAIPSPEKVASILEAVKKTRFDYHAPIPNPDAVLTITQDGRVRKVGGFGQIGVFSGHEKSGKSFVLSCVAASAFGGEVMGFKLDLRGRKMIWIDTEQSAEFYSLTQRRIHNLAGLSTNATNYAAYHLRNFSAQERLEAIDGIISECENLGVLVIDGFVDLLLDYNSLPEVQLLVSRLMKLSFERHILILGVLHLNKGDGKIRGHAGSELKNKGDFLINVTREERLYKVSNPFSRYGEFKPFDFERDDAGGLSRFDGNDFVAVPSFSPLKDFSEMQTKNEEDIPF